MVKYSDVYESEIEKDRVFKKAKVYLCLLCLLTIALLMSFVSQNFYWAFALFIGLPIYFFGMNLLFRYQANSLNSNQNGCICMGCSILWIFGLIGLFTYLYLTSYATYFSQKYTGMWCRGYAIEKVDTSTQQYNSITYEIIDDVALYKKQRGITNDLTQTSTPSPLPNQIYGCGCTSNKKREMSAKGLHGYDYSFKNDGSLELLPFWLCEQTSEEYQPILQDYSDIYRCYIHAYNKPSEAQQKDPNMCSTSDSFIQITFDTPPYYSYQQFLYMIGFIFLTIFGVACNFPMTYLVLKVQYKHVMVKDFKQPTDRRKILLCCALKKVLMIDRINQQKQQIGIQNQLIPAISAITNKSAAFTQSRNQQDQKSQIAIQNCIKDLKIPENQSITFFRKEIIEELIEFLYTDNVHYHIVKRRQMSMQRNRAQSHFTNSNVNNLSQIDQINHNNLSQNIQQPPSNQLQPIQYNPSQLNHTVININPMVNIQQNNLPNSSQLPPSNPNPNTSILPSSNNQSNPGQLQFFSQINTINATSENQRFNERNNNNQNERIEIDRNSNQLQNNQYSNNLQNNNNILNNINNNEINGQYQIEQQQGNEGNRDILNTHQFSVRSEQAATFTNLFQHNQQQNQTQNDQFEQMNLKRNKSNKQGFSIKEEEEFKSEDYRNDDDLNDEEIQWNNFDTNSGYNDFNNSIHRQSIQQYSGNNLKLRNRQNSYSLPPPHLLSSFSNQQLHIQQHQNLQHEEQSQNLHQFHEIEHTLSDNRQNINSNLNLEQQFNLQTINLQIQIEDLDKENQEIKVNNHEQLATHPCDTSFGKCKLNDKSNDSPTSLFQKSAENNNMDQIKGDLEEQ